MAALTWCIAFPYAPNEPIRAEAFAIVSEFYRRHFPEVEQLTHTATPVGTPFLRARTRNELVTIADDAGYDVVALIDADTIVHPDGIRRMVAMAAHRLLFLGKPFRRGVNRPLEQQRHLLDSLTDWPRARFNDPGAAWVIRPESWWAAGGMDESFTGWGGEDSAFEHLFVAAGGTVTYDALPAVKTEHAQERRTAPTYPTTLDRELVCKHIRDHPHLLTDWLTTRNQPNVVHEWMHRHHIVNPRRRKQQPINR